MITRNGATSKPAKQPAPVPSAAARSARTSRRPRRRQRPTTPKPDPEEPGMEQARAAGQERDARPARRSPARSRGPVAPSGARPCPAAAGAQDQLAQAQRGQHDQPGGGHDRQPLGEVLDVAQFAAGPRPAATVGSVHAGHDAGEGVRQRRPRSAQISPRWPGELGNGSHQEPAQPGQFEQAEDDQGPAAAPRHPARPATTLSGDALQCSIVLGFRGSARSCQGANSSSPTPVRSLLVGSPPATSRIRSKSRRPTLSTGSPSRIVPGVEVHVVAHPLVHRRVGRDLDAGRRLAGPARCRGRW